LTYRLSMPYRFSITHRQSISQETLMRRPSPQRDPLAPVEFVATFLLATSAFVILLAVLFAVLGRGTFIGEDQPCLSLRSGVLSQYEVTTPSAPEAEPFRPLPKGTKLSPERTRVCASDLPESLLRRFPHAGLDDSHPTSAQRWWNRLAAWPPLLYGMGALAFVWWLARRARREGFFVPGVARGLSRLGVYLGIGSVVTSVVVLLANKQLLDTLLPTGGYWDIGLNLSWSTLLTSVGLVSLGRVMAHAVAMREELDTTV